MTPSQRSAAVRLMDRERVAPLRQALPDRLLPNTVLPGAPVLPAAPLLAALFLAALAIPARPQSAPRGASDSSAVSAPATHGAPDSAGVTPRAAGEPAALPLLWQAGIGHGATAPALVADGRLYV